MKSSLLSGTEINESRGRSQLPLWLLSNFFIKLPFFAFKYTGVLYFVHLFGSENRARILFSWTFGLAYILPVVWSAMINSVRAQCLAVCFGGLFLTVSFIALAGGSFPFPSALLFAIGFG